MEKIEELMLATRIKMQQLQDQIDAQHIVIAWLLADRDRLAPEGDSAANFLINQSMMLTESVKSDELLAVFDALAEDVARFASPRDNPG